MLVSYGCVRDRCHDTLANIQDDGHIHLKCATQNVFIDGRSQLFGDFCFLRVILSPILCSLNSQWSGSYLKGQSDAEALTSRHTDTEDLLYIQRLRLP